MEQIPKYWKTNLTDIKETLDTIILGKTRVLGYSAGKREILSVEYGEKQDMERTANFSSAVGAGDAGCYAKKGEGIKPVILLVGAEHGGEMEGIAGLMNLISIIENGEDLRGKKWDYLSENWRKFRLIIIPCMNPDGRSRIPFDSMVGKTMETMRYYLQGTWKDGSLCGWPDCKKVHPMINNVGFLGSYFNDDGINIVQDNVFLPMAEETKILFRLADDEAPDFIVHLHGGDNCISMIMPPEYEAEYVKNRVQEFDLALDERCKSRGLRYYAFDKTSPDGVTGPASFRITSAIHHICGGISVIYESNMGLDYPELPIYTYDEILDSHLTLFEEILRYMDDKQTGKVKEG